MRIIAFLFFIVIATACVAQSHTFVFLNSRKDKAELPKEELDKLMDAHLKNIERLAKEGKLIVAGPFDGGGGIFIMNTPSVELANQWIGTDPAIQANRWRIEVLPYQPRIGSVCAAKETSEMVSYSFVRFLPNIHKETVGKYAENLALHDEYIKKLSKTEPIIAEGFFGQDGNIMIINGEISPELIENDPGVKGGAFLFEIKKVWVAKGSFCE